MQDPFIYAIGVAVSPIAIGPIVLLLSRPRPLLGATAFAAGWIAGVAALSVALIAVVDGADVTDADPTALAIIDLAIGAAFIVAAGRISQRHRRRQRRPAVLAALDAASARRTATLGLVVSGVNPKVWALSLAAAIAISAEGAATATEAWRVAGFVAIGSIGVLVPLAVYAAAPERARPALAVFRSWLGRHETGVLVVFGLAIGALFLREGITALG